MEWNGTSCSAGFQTPLLTSPTKKSNGRIKDHCSFLNRLFIFSLLFGPFGLLSSCSNSDALAIAKSASDRLKLDDPVSSPMSLSEVCQHLNVGQASLYRACQDSFGMGIIEMMTQVRLEEARRSMIYHTTTSTCDNNTIREIAIRFGFKHQGRFSRRYFTSFGELPSQTLKRATLL